MPYTTVRQHADTTTANNVNQLRDTARATRLNARTAAQINNGAFNTVAEYPWARVQERTAAVG
jgi:hypothetical protein